MATEPLPSWIQLWKILGQEKENPAPVIVIFFVILGWQIVVDNNWI